MAREIARLVYDTYKLCYADSEVRLLAFLLPPFLPSSVRLPLFQCDASLVIAVVQTGSIFDPDKHKKYEAEYYYQ
eukprot:642789-Rhodomonas_salina.1